MIEKNNKSIPKNYIDLVKEYPLLPIKNDREEAAAQEIIEKILEIEEQKELTEGQENYLDTLTLILGEYQRKKLPIPDIHGIDLLRLLIVENGLRQKDLIDIFKTESIISAILNKKRNLTVEQMFSFSIFPSIRLDKLKGQNIKAL